MILLLFVSRRTLICPSRPSLHHPSDSKGRQGRWLAGVLTHCTLGFSVCVLYCSAWSQRGECYPCACHSAWHFPGPLCCNSELKDDLTEASGPCSFTHRCPFGHSLRNSTYLNDSQLTWQVHRVLCNHYGGEMLPQPPGASAGGFVFIKSGPSKPGSAK